MMKKEFLFPTKSVLFDQRVQIGGALTEGQRNRNAIFFFSNLHLISDQSCRWRLGEVTFGQKKIAFTLMATNGRSSFYLLGVIIFYLFDRLKIESKNNNS